MFDDIIAHEVMHVLRINAHIKYDESHMFKRSSRDTKKNIIIYLNCGHRDEYNSISFDDIFLFISISIQYFFSFVLFDQL